MVARLRYDGAQCFFGVEGRVVHDDNGGFGEFRQQRLLHPGDDGEAIAAVRKQHGSEPFFAALRHDEVGGFAIAAGHIAEYFLATFCPTVGAETVFLKAALIDVDEIFLAVDWQQAAQFAQISYAFFVISLRIPRRFFYACRAHAAP